MKQIHSFKAYSSSFDTLIRRNKKKTQETSIQNIPESTIKSLIDSGIIGKGN